MTPAHEPCQRTMSPHRASQERTRVMGALHRLKFGIRRTKLPFGMLERPCLAALLAPVSTLRPLKCAESFWVRIFVEYIQQLLYHKVGNGAGLGARRSASLIVWLLAHAADFAWGEGGSGSFPPLHLESIATHESATGSIKTTTFA